VPRLSRSLNAPGLPKECADEAMKLLQQAVAKGY
jgi:hypothetical protein